jgi:hypothetical protein
MHLLLRHVHFFSCEEADGKPRSSMDPNGSRARWSPEAFLFPVGALFPELACLPLGPAEKKSSTGGSPKAAMSSEPGRGKFDSITQHTKVSPSFASSSRGLSSSSSISHPSQKKERVFESDEFDFAAVVDCPMRPSFVFTAILNSPQLDEVCIESKKSVSQRRRTQLVVCLAFTASILLTDSPAMIAKIFNRMKLIA